MMWNFITFHLRRLRERAAAGAAVSSFAFSKKSSTPKKKDKKNKGERPDLVENWGICYSHFTRDHYLGRYYILRHVYHTNTKNSVYSRTCLFLELHCYIPNVNNR